MNPICYSFLLSFILALTLPARAEQYSVKSPDGTITLTLDYSESDNTLLYCISRNGSEVVAPSALGLRLNTTTMNSFTSGVTVSTSETDETYSLPHGKTSLYQNHYKEITLSGNAANRQRNLTVRFRVYNDGVAFRYELENRRGNSVTADLSEFNISNFENARAQRYHNDYSWYYECRDWAAMQQEAAFNVPVLVKCGDKSYILLTEAASTSAMSASRVVTGNKTGQLCLQPAADSEITDSQFASPWRAMMIGTLHEIVESTMMTNLNEATSLTNLEWVKPGRVAWNWGAEDGDSAPTVDQARRYIDFAAAMGWEYFLLDDGWDGRIDLSEISDYARQHGVNLLIWSHQNRFANDYDNILAWFSYWESLGIKGIKIDFFEDDSQQMLRKYENMLRAAADCHMMLNFHGCTKPSGLERTWPHLMTSEAVLGGEFYMFNTTMTPGSHTVNLTLTRNVLGGMDYTPVKFGNKHGRVITDTSWAYQLALAVAFESSLQSFCDTPENILGSIAEPALRLLPASWDELKCLDAEPDKYVTLARRKDNDWWIASITNDSRNIQLSLDFLDHGRTYFAHIYSEGFHRSDIAYECREVSSGDVIELTAGNHSGAMVILSTDNELLRPFSVKMEAEKYNRYCDRIADASCSGGAYLDNVGGNRKMVRFTDVTVPEDGEYNLTLFYLTKGVRDAYVQVNDGERLYHSFRDSDGRLAFVTVPVTLAQGSNIICIGNENGSAPALDRAVVSHCTKGDGKPASVADAACDAICTIVPSGDAVVVNTLSDALATIYNAAGMKLSEQKIAAGVNTLPIATKGMCIVNIRSNSLSISKKIIIK